MASGVQREAVAGATIHPFAPRRRPAESRDLRFVFRIENYPHLAQVFGVAVAEQAVDETVSILAKVLGRGGQVMREGAELIGAVLWDAPPLNGAQARADFVRAVSTAISLHPVATKAGPVHVSIGGGVPGTLGAVQCPGGLDGAGSDWARRYRRDMAEAATLLDAVEHDRVMLAWQPIRATGTSDEVLYHEALFRAAADDGTRISPATALPALERLGLVRLFDEQLVGRVLDELENDATVTLGVNISAQSAILDHWWAGIVERLSMRPSVARRLILEITQSACLPTAEAVIVFAGRMRGLGCRLAVDDFGRGHASIGRLLALKPDLVKLDGAFLRCMALSDRDRAIFEHMLGLASALSPIVIAGGAETEALSDAARKAGARWHQGHAAGSPGTLRSWRTAGTVRAMAAGGRGGFAAGRENRVAGEE